MSALSTAGLGSSLPVSSLAAVDPAREPASVRNGDAAAKKAYQEGLAFENILVNQLAQEMTASVPGLDGSPSSSGDGLGGTAADGGPGGSTGGLGPYASMLPQALTSSVMSGGGTGIALQIARAIDPALGQVTK